MNLKILYRNAMQILILLIFLYLLSVKSLAIYAVLYSIEALFLLFYTLTSKLRRSVKCMLIFLYLLLLSAQQVFLVMFCFAGEVSGMVFLLKKFAAILVIFAPIIVAYLTYLYSLNRQFFALGKDAAAISFELLKEAHSRAESMKESLQKNADSLRPENLSEIAKDLPRHSYSRYLNRETLTEEYFEDCRRSMDDLNLYIVLSSTGSPASEIISVFTQKTFNHVSLSFDQELKTIISYNGGENVSPPGLNKEYLESFRKKEDASVLVYRIQATQLQKMIVLDKIMEINSKGSAYNLVGLVTKFSIRPNIMFCSQFVYLMLKIAGLSYFTDAAAKVKPSDFVERDYYRKLEFCYEIKFNELEL